jgi:4-hydroxybenzoate polyprenyltransferase
MKEWIKLARAEHGLLTAIAVIIGEIIAAKGFCSGFIYPAIGPALITLAAFVTNDYFDYETDKANKRRDRPLVSGKIKKKDALAAAVFFYCAGLLATMFHPIAFLIALIYAVFSVAYTPLLKKKPLVGNVYIASTMAIPFIYGNVVVSGILAQEIVLLSSIAFLSGVGREFLNTLRDVKGDKKIGAMTLPMFVGAKATVLLASLLILAAVFLSFIPLQEKIVYSYLIPVIVADALFVYAVLIALLRQDVASLKKCRNLTLMALFFGLVAFLALALS